MKFSQFIVTFALKLLLDEQNDYLLSNNTCLLAYSDFIKWEFPTRPFYIRSIPTEHSILKLSMKENQGQKGREKIQSLIECLLSDSLIHSIHQDSLCNRNVMSSAPSFSADPDPHDVERNKTSSSSFLPSQLSLKYNQLGYNGQGIQIGIFDTGLSTNHPSFKSYERYDWTTEESIEDEIGHGTFVAGIIGNLSPQCPGMASQSILHIFRIFTKNQKSYTSWFLDAFNYAIFLKIHLINLSIGGPDHNDIPFRKKIDEMAENGIIIISAMGNTGPIWGTANSPADQNSVIGVGGWLHENKISSFSSRGMSVWEIPHGIGRFKPDLVAPSFNLISISSTSPYQCYQLSGTSVATPVVTGAIAVFLSSLPSRPHAAPGDQPSPLTTTSSLSLSLHREDLLNIAAIKQILILSSTKLVNKVPATPPQDTPTIFEQGAGLLNLDEIMRTTLKSFQPHVSFWPNRVSNHPKDCPYLWPFCDQQLYLTSQPLLLNVTILNSLVATSGIYRIEYLEITKEFGESSDGISFSLSPTQQHTSHQHHHVTLHGTVLVVKVDFYEILSSWCGLMGISIGLNRYSPHDYEGNVTGMVTIYVGDVRSHSFNSKIFSNMKYFEWEVNQKATFLIDVMVTKPPERKQRLLWDVFHSLSYPSPYVPNDNPATDARSSSLPLTLPSPSPSLSSHPSPSSTLFDHYGDHPYTNYRSVYSNPPPPSPSFSVDLFLILLPALPPHPPPSSLGTPICISES
jgi:hypothetical protein